jgi:hypothetical protein
MIPVQINNKSLTYNPPLFKIAGSIFAVALNWRIWYRAFRKIPFEQLERNSRR